MRPNYNLSLVGLGLGYDLQASAHAKMLASATSTWLRLPLLQKNIIG